MAYGTVVIQDGVYVPNHGSPTDSQRRSPVRFAGQTEAIPPRLEPKSGLKTFVVDLYYSENRVVYSGGRVLSTDLKIDYSKQFTRIASDRNPVKDTKAFVAQFAGCDEASKLRKRIIALSRIHNSISNETLRFGVS